MTIQQTISRAMDGGYKTWPIEWGNTPLVKCGKRAWFRNGITKRDTSLTLPEIFMDASFWQSLGKALGWKKIIIGGKIKFAYPGWEYQWHRFIDYLIFGKNAEEFFKQF